MIVRCLEDKHYEDLKLYVSRVAAVMIEYEWLINAKLINFYCDNSWSKLTSSWQDYLGELTTDHLAQWLANEPITIHKVMPLSMQCFRVVAKQCSFAREESNLNELNQLADSLKHLPGGDQSRLSDTADRRANRPNGHQPNTNLPNGYRPNMNLPKGHRPKGHRPNTNLPNGHRPSSHQTNGDDQSDDQSDDQTQSYKITELNRIDLKEIFIKNLNIKKQHEVGRFSSLIANALDPQAVQLVDFGSGRGHLARFLSLYFGFRVTTLELEESTSKRAAELDLRALQYCENQNKKREQSNFQAKPSLPKHLNVRVTSDLELDLDADGESTKKVAIGLHACGSLSRSIIELYKDGFADYLLLVSCCYHMDTSANGRGFILSETVKSSLANYRNLNHETKEIACHSVELSIDQLRGDHSQLRVHCYRALLEDTFERYSPGFRMADLAKVRRIERLDYSTYAKNAIRNLPLKLEDDQLNDELTRTRLENYLQVIRFYFLRLTLAPMIENLIQVDRMLYLYENGLRSLLCNLFDPKQSPRNTVLCSFR